MMKRRLIDPDQLAIPRIDEAPTYRAAIAELKQLKERLAETHQRRQRAEARLRGIRPARSVADRAKDLLAGGKIPGATARGEIEAAEAEEFEVLRPAIAEVNVRLGELRRDLSYDASVQLRQAYDDGLRELLRGVEMISIAAKVVLGIRARLATAGYQPNESVLLGTIPPAVLAIGDPAHQGVSPAWFFAEKLRARGVVI